MLFSWSLAAVAAVGSTCIGTYVLFIVVYRLWFHPLSKIPGPFLQRISGLPRIWQCYMGNRHHCETEAHHKYGRVIRIGPNSICFNTLSGLQTIHVKSANVFKGDEFYGLLDGGPEGGQSIQMTQTNEEHAKRRRVLDHALPSRSRAFTEINRLSRHFADTIYSISLVNGGKVNMTQVTTWYSFDVINKLAFGESTNMLDSDEYRWLPRCLQDTSVFLYSAGYASYLRFWRWFLGSRWPSRLAFRPAIAAQKYADFAFDRVVERKARMEEEKTDTTQAPDIFKSLIQTGLFQDLDLRADSSLLIAAGSDAVRLVIVSTLYYWLRNPDTLGKAVEEIRSHGPDYPDNITESTIASLKYLRACVDESMRLTPPKPSSVPREVKAGGIVCDGIRVPKGMTAGISTYSLHHDPEIYPRPWEYNPERWLQRPLDPRMQNAFHPFLKGPRACPGKTVAYFAIQLALFHLVSRFDITSTDDVNGGSAKFSRISSEQKDEYPFNDWMIGFGDGPVIGLHAVNTRE